MTVRLAAISIFLPFLLGGCDWFGNEQEAFAVADINEQNWTGHASASVNTFDSNGLDIKVVVVNALSGVREELSLPNLPRRTGRWTLKKFPINSQGEDDPFVYFTSRVLSSDADTKEFILDSSADNYVDISLVESDKFESGFQLIVVSLRPDATDMDTLKINKGFFSVPL